MSAGGSAASAGDRAVSDEELVAAAREARKAAYRPYSGFAVGAALLSADGRVFVGCNVENSSYGLTACAERVAVWRGGGEGGGGGTARGVVADGADPAVPCGACLRVVSEFAPDLAVVLANRAGQVVRHTLRELLPRPFLSVKSAATRRAADASVAGASLLGPSADAGPGAE